MKRTTFLYVYLFEQGLILLDLAPAFGVLLLLPLLEFDLLSSDCAHVGSPEHEVNESYQELHHSQSMHYAVLVEVEGDSVAIHCIKEQLQSN